jgi:3-oxoacyl-[acyl-carrier protein] reductase
MNAEPKIALVTGATRGIGKSIALTLAKSGLKVVGTATSEKGMEAITAYFKEAGLEGQGRVLDVGEDDSRQALQTQLKETVGLPDILVNNAGVTRDNLLMRMKPEEWAAVIQTNLTGVFALIKQYTRHMMKKRWGRVVNIGSIVGSTGNPGQPNYCAAKAGVMGLTKSVALELASRNITANVVAPGFIDTDMTRVLPEDQREALLQHIPLGRMGSPEDIANMVAFLVGESGGYITGQTFHVNGGMYLA